MFYDENKELIEETIQKFNDLKNCPFENGDLILYDWDDDGIGDCKGWSDHVGIVLSVTNNKIKVIECNKSKTVGYRTISVNGKYIRGFITPKFKKEAKRKTIDEIAHEVIAGKWGNGAYRRQALKKAGYDYFAVQRRVNQLLAVYLIKRRLICF